MKKFFPLALLTVLMTVFGLTAASAQEAKLTSPASIRGVIVLKPGTAKNLPTLFTVATKTRLFLAIADDLKLTDEQKAKLEEIHSGLQQFVVTAKADYDKRNEGLHAILSSDRIELETMRENLRAAEQLKADMQYSLFEALVKAANVLTPAQQQQIVDGMQIDDLK